MFGSVCKGITDFHQGFPKEVFPSPLSSFFHAAQDGLLRRHSNAPDQVLWGALKQLLVASLYKSMSKALILGELCMQDSKKKIRDDFLPCLGIKARHLSSKEFLLSGVLGVHDLLCNHVVSKQQCLLMHDCLLDIVICHTCIEKGRRGLIAHKSAGGLQKKTLQSFFFQSLMVILLWHWPACVVNRRRGGRNI